MFRTSNHLPSVTTLNTMKNMHTSPSSHKSSTANMLRNVTQRAIQRTMMTLQRTPTNVHSTSAPAPAPAFITSTLFTKTQQTTQLAQLYSHKFRHFSTVTQTRRQLTLSPTSHRTPASFSAIFPQHHTHTRTHTIPFQSPSSTRCLHNASFHSTSSLSSTSFKRFHTFSSTSISKSKSFHPTHTTRVLPKDISEDRVRELEQEVSAELRTKKLLPPIPTRSKEVLKLSKEEMDFFGLSKDNAVAYDSSLAQDEFSQLKKRKLFKLHAVCAIASMIYAYFLYDQHQQILLEKELGLYDPEEEREQFFRWAYLKAFDSNSHASDGVFSNSSNFVPGTSVTSPGNGLIQPQYAYPGAEQHQDSAEYDPYGYLAAPKYRKRQENERNRSNTSSNPEISRYIANQQSSDLRKQTFLGDIATQVRGLVQPQQTPEVLDGLSKRWQKTSSDPAFQRQYQSDLDSMKMYTDRKIPRYMDFEDDPDKRDFFYERVNDGSIDDGDYDYYNATDDVVESDVNELEGGMFRYRNDEALAERLGETGYLSPYSDGGFREDIENRSDSLFMETQRIPYPAHYRQRDQVQRQDISGLSHSLLQLTPEERISLLENQLGFKVEGGGKSNARKAAQAIMAKSDQLNVPPTVMEELLNRTSYKNLFRRDGFDIDDPFGKRERHHVEDFPGQSDTDYYDPSRETVFRMSGGVPIASDAYPSVYDAFNEFKFDNDESIDYIDGIPFFDMQQFRRANAFTQSTLLLDLIQRGFLPSIDSYEPNSQINLPPVILHEVPRDNFTQRLSPHQIDQHAKKDKSVRTLNASLALIGHGARTTFSTISNSFLSTLQTWLPQSLKHFLHYLPSQAHYSIGIYLDSSLFVQHFSRILPFTQSIRNENFYRSRLRLSKLPVWDHTREEYEQLLSIPPRNQNQTIIQRIQHLFSRLRYRSFGPKLLTEPSIPHFQKVFPHAESKSIALALTSKISGSWLSEEFNRLFTPNICDGRPISTLRNEPNYNDFGIPIPITPTTLGMHTYRMKFALLSEYRQAKEYATNLGVTEAEFESQFPMTELSLQKQMLFSNKSIRYQFDQYQSIRNRQTNDLKAALYASQAQMDIGMGPNDTIEANTSINQDLTALDDSANSSLELFLEQEKLDLGPQPISLSTTIALKTFMNLLETTEAFSPNQTLSFSWGVNNEYVMIKLPIPVLHAMMEFSVDPKFLLSYEMYKSIEHNIKHGFTPTGIDFELLLQHFGTTNAEVNKSLRDEHDKLVELQTKQLLQLQQQEIYQKQLLEQGMHNQDEFKNNKYQLTNITSPFTDSAMPSTTLQDLPFVDPMTMQSQGTIHAGHVKKNSPASAFDLPSSNSSSSSNISGLNSYNGMIQDGDDLSQHAGAFFQIIDPVTGFPMETTPLTTSLRDVSDQTQLNSMLRLPPSMEASGARMARSVLIEHHDMVHNADYRRQLLLKEFPPDKPFPGLAYYRKKYAAEGKSNEKIKIGEKNELFPQGLTAPQTDHKSSQMDMFGNLYSNADQSTASAPTSQQKKSRYDQFVVSSSARLIPLGDQYLQEHPLEAKRRERLMGPVINAEDNLIARIRFRDFFTEEHPEALIALTNPMAPDSLTITDPKMLLILQEYAQDKRTRDLNKNAHFPLIGQDTNRNILLARREEEIRSHFSGPTVRYAGEGEDEAILIENSGLTDINFDLTTDKFILFLAQDHARRHEKLLEALDQLHQENGGIIPDQQSRKLAKLEAQQKKAQMHSQAVEIDKKMKELREQKIENYKKQLRIERGLSATDDTLDDELFDGTAFSDPMQQSPGGDSIFDTNTDLRESLRDFNPNLASEKLAAKITTMDIDADHADDNEYHLQASPIKKYLPEGVELVGNSGDYTTTSDPDTDEDDEHFNANKYKYNFSNLPEFQKNKSLAKISQALAQIPPPTSSSIISSINSHRSKLKDRYYRLQKLSAEADELRLRQSDPSKDNPTHQTDQKSSQIHRDDDADIDFGSDFDYNKRFDDSYVATKHRQYDPRLIQTIPNTSIPIPKLASETSLPYETAYINQLSQEMLNFKPELYQYNSADEPKTRAFKRQKLSDYHEWLRITNEDSHSTNLSTNVDRHIDNSALTKLNNLLGHVGSPTGEKPALEHTTFNVGANSTYRRQNPDERQDPHFIRNLQSKELTSSHSPSSISYKGNSFPDLQFGKQKGLDGKTRHGVLGEAERFLQNFSTLNQNMSSYDFEAQMTVGMLSDRELRENQYLYDKYAHLNPQNKDAIKAHREKEAKKRQFDHLSPSERLKTKEGVRNSLENQKFKRRSERKRANQDNFVPKRHSAFKEKGQKQPRWVSPSSNDPLQNGLFDNDDYFNDTDDLFSFKLNLDDDLSRDEYEDKYPFLSAEQQNSLKYRSTPPNKGHTDADSHAWDEEAALETKLTDGRSHRLFELKHPDEKIYGFNPHSIEQDMWEDQRYQEDIENKKRAQLDKGSLFNPGTLRGQGRDGTVINTNPLTAFDQLDKLINDPTLNTKKPETVRDMISMYYRHALEMLTHNYQDQVLQRLEFLQDIVMTEENEFPTGWYPDQNELHIATFNPTAVVAHIEAALNINQFLDLNVELPLSNTLLKIERVGVDGTLELSSSQELTMHDHSSWLTNQLPTKYHEQFKHLSTFNVQPGAPTDSEIDQFRIYDTQRALLLNDQEMIDKMFGVTNLKTEIKKVLSKYHLRPDEIQADHERTGMFSGVKQYIDSDLPSKYDQMGVSGNPMEDRDKKSHQNMLDNPKLAKRRMDHMQRLDDYVRGTSDNHAGIRDVARYEQEFEQFVGEENATTRKLQQKEQIEEAMRQYEETMMQSRVNKLARLQTQTEAILIIKDPLFSAAIMRAFLGTSGHTEDQLESFLHEQLLKYNVIHNPLNNSSVYDAEDATTKPIEMSNPLTGEVTQHSTAAHHLRTGHPIDRTLIQRLNHVWLNWCPPDSFLPPHQRRHRIDTEPLPVDKNISHFPSEFRQNDDFDPEDPHYHAFHSPATSGDPLTLNVLHNLKISDYEIVDTTWDQRILQRIDLVEAIPPFFLPLLTQFNDRLNPHRTNAAIKNFLPPHVLQLLSHDTTVFQPFLDKVNRFKKHKMREIAHLRHQASIDGNPMGFKPAYLNAINDIDNDPWNIDMEDLFEQHQFEKEQEYISDDIQWDLGHMISNTHLFDLIQYNIRQVIIGQKKFKELQAQDEKAKQDEVLRLEKDFYSALPSNRLRDNLTGSTVDLQQKLSAMYNDNLAKDDAFREKSMQYLLGAIDLDGEGIDDDDDGILDDQELEKIALTHNDPVLRKHAVDRLTQRRKRQQLRFDALNAATDSNMNQNGGSVQKNIYEMTPEEARKHRVKYGLPKHHETFDYNQYRWQKDNLATSEVPLHLQNNAHEHERRAYDDDRYLATFVNEPLHVNTFLKDNNDDVNNDNDDDDDDGYVYGETNVDKRNKNARKERLRRQRAEMSSKNKYSTITEANELSSSLNQMTDTWSTVAQESFETGKEIWKEHKATELLADMRLKQIRDVEMQREKRDYYRRVTGRDDYDDDFDEMLYQEEQNQVHKKGTNTRGYYDINAASNRDSTLSNTVSLIKKPFQKLHVSSQHLLNKSLRYLSSSIDRQVQRKYRDLSQQRINDELSRQHNPVGLPGHQFVMNELGRSKNVDAQRFLSSLNSGILTHDQAQVVHQYGLAGAVDYYRNGSQSVSDPAQDESYNPYKSPIKSIQREALNVDLEKEWAYAERVQKMQLLDQPFLPPGGMDELMGSSTSSSSQQQPRRYPGAKEPKTSPQQQQLQQQRQLRQSHQKQRQTHSLFNTDNDDVHDSLDQRFGFDSSHRRYHKNSSNSNYPNYSNSNNYGGDDDDDDDDDDSFDLSQLDSEQQNAIMGLVNQLLSENDIDLNGMDEQKQQHVLNAAVNQVIVLLQDQAQNGDDDDDDDDDDE